MVFSLETRRGVTESYSDHQQDAMGKEEQGNEAAQGYSIPLCEVHDEEEFGNQDLRADFCALY